LRPISFSKFTLADQAQVYKFKVQSNLKQEVTYEIAMAL